MGAAWANRWQTRTTSADLYHVYRPAGGSTPNGTHHNHHAIVNEGTDAYVIDVYHAHPGESHDHQLTLTVELREPEELPALLDGLGLTHTGE